MNDEFNLSDILEDLGITPSPFNEMENVIIAENVESQHPTEVNSTLNQPYTVQNIENGQVIEVQPILDSNQNRPMQCINPNLMHFNRGGIETQLSSPQSLAASPMASPINQSHIANMSLAFTRMPERTIRFRSRNDSNTHGVVKGSVSTSSSSDCYPTIQFKVSDVETQKHKFYVMGYCYIKSTESSPILSPHIFAQKRPRKNRKNVNEPKYDVIERPILEPIKEKSPGVFEYSFENYFIISQSKEGIDAVKSKYEKLYNLGLITKENLDKTISDIETKEDIIKQSNNAVCLGFSIYEKTLNGYEFVLGPELSSPIIHANKTVELVRVCTKRGPVKGGDEITLLVAGITEKNTTVVMKEDISEGQPWSAEIKEFIDVHQKAAITFTLPPYTGQNHISGDINCHIYLRRDDGAKSDLSRFIYERFKEPKRKNPRRDDAPNETLTASTATPIQTDKKTAKTDKHGCQFFIDSICTSPHVEKREVDTKALKTIHKTESLEEAINRLIRFLKATHLENECENNYKLFDYTSDLENTILHDAIEFDKFEKLYANVKRAQLKKFISVLEGNIYGDSLLHHACRLGKSKYIRPLIGLNYGLSKQNNDRKTPLHLAIESSDKKTIDIWVDLLESPTDYDNFIEEFERNLSVYDRLGYTVLHRAVINDQRRLVEAIMKFYQKADIHLNKYEVLGNGDSILHLAAARGLKEMAQLIIKMEPDAEYYENYAGKEPQEDFIKMLENLSFN